MPWELWLICESNVKILMAETPGDLDVAETNDFVVGDVVVARRAHGEFADFVKLRIKRQKRKQWIRIMSPNDASYQLAKIHSNGELTDSVPLFRHSYNDLPAYKAPMEHFAELAKSMIAFAHEIEIEEAAIVHSSDSERYTDSEYIRALVEYLFSPMLLVSLEYLPLTAPLLSVQSTIYRGTVFWTMYTQPFFHRGIEAREFLRRLDIQHKYTHLRRYDPLWEKRAYQQYERGLLALRNQVDPDYERRRRHYLRKRRRRLRQHEREPFAAGFESSESLSSSLSDSDSDSDSHRESDEMERMHAVDLSKEPAFDAMYDGSAKVATTMSAPSSMSSAAGGRSKSAQSSQTEDCLHAPDFARSGVQLAISGKLLSLTSLPMRKSTVELPEFDRDQTTDDDLQDEDDDDSSAAFLRTTSLPSSLRRGPPKKSGRIVLSPPRDDSLASASASTTTTTVVSPSTSSSQSGYLSSALAPYSLDDEDIVYDAMHATVSERTMDELRETSSLGGSEVLRGEAQFRERHANLMRRMAKKHRLPELPQMPQWITDIFSSAARRAEVSFVARLYLVDLRNTSERILSPKQNLDKMEAMRHRPFLSGFSEGAEVEYTATDAVRRCRVSSASDGSAAETEESAQGKGAVDSSSEEYRVGDEESSSGEGTPTPSDKEIERREVKSKKSRLLLTGSRVSERAPDFFGEAKGCGQHSFVATLRSAKHKDKRKMYLVCEKHSSRLRDVVQVNESDRGSQWFRVSFHKRRHCVLSAPKTARLIRVKWRKVAVTVGGNYGAERSRHYCSMVFDDKKPLPHFLPLLTVNAIVCGSARELTRILKQTTDSSGTDSTAADDTLG